MPKASWPVATSQQTAWPSPWSVGEEEVGAAVHPAEPGRTAARPASRGSTERRRGPAPIAPRPATPAAEAGAEDSPAPDSSGSADAVPTVPLEAAARHEPRRAAPVGEPAGVAATCPVPATVSAVGVPTAPRAGRALDGLLQGKSAGVSPCRAPAGAATSGRRGPEDAEPMEPRGEAARYALRPRSGQWKTRRKRKRLRRRVRGCLAVTKRCRVVP